MTHPAERRLARIATDIGWAQQRVPDVRAALEILAPVGYPAGRGDGRGGATSTSVEAAAIDHPARQAAEELDARAAELAGHVTEFINHLKHMPTRIDPRLKHNAAAEAQRARCTGGEGDWADPDCDRLEVKTVPSEEIRGTRLGVCWTCNSRRTRYLAQARIDEAS